jgi:hypothetical protein
MERNSIGREAYCPILIEAEVEVQNIDWPRVTRWPGTEMGVTPG